MTNKTDLEILEDSAREINEWYSAYEKNNERAIKNREFTYQDQWDTGVASDRYHANKKTLTFNVLKPIVRSLLGQQRKSTPQLAVNPVEGGASQKDANIVASILRQIQISSGADIVYQNAFRDEIDCGYGAFGIGLEYEREGSFNIHPKIYSIPDCTYSYFDPSAIELTKCDGDYAGYYYKISKSNFNRAYPGIDYAGAVSATASIFPWAPDDSVVICNHYVKEYYTERLIKIESGEILDQKKWTALRKEINEEAEYLGIEPVYPKIINDRKYSAYNIMNYKLIANEVLDKVEWQSKLLPIIYVPGDKVNIDGRETTLPFLEDAHDAQRLINYSNSEIASSMATSRDEKFIGTPGNIKGHEKTWSNPNAKKGILLSNPDPKTGQMPQVVNPPPFNEQLLSIVAEQQQQIKSSLGRYDESAGNQSNVVSGSAVLARQAASDNSVEVFYDNLNIAIEQGGKVLLSLIPKIYSEQRDIIVRDKDGSSKNITINKIKRPTEGEGDSVEYELENEVKDLEYGIELISEPNFEYQKAQSFSQYSSFVQMSGNPAQTFPLIADLVASDLNTKESKEVATRMRDNVVPKQVVAQEEGKKLPPPQPSPEEQQQVFENKLEVEKLKVQKADTLGKLIGQLVGLEKSKDEMALEAYRVKGENDREEERLAMESQNHLQDKIAELLREEDNYLT